MRRLGADGMHRCASARPHRVSHGRRGGGRTAREVGRRKSVAAQRNNARRNVATTSAAFPLRHRPTALPRCNNARRVATTRAALQLRAALQQRALRCSCALRCNCVATALQLRCNVAASRPHLLVGATQTKPARKNIARERISGGGVPALLTKNSALPTCRTPSAGRRYAQAARPRPHVRVWAWEVGPDFRSLRPGTHTGRVRARVGCSLLL